MTWVYIQTYPSSKDTPEVWAEIGSCCQTSKHDQTGEVEEDPIERHHDRTMVVWTYNAMGRIRASIPVERKLVGKTEGGHVSEVLLNLFSRTWRFEDDEAVQGESPDWSRETVELIQSRISGLAERSYVIRRAQGRMELQ